MNTQLFPGINELQTNQKLKRRQSDLTLLQAHRKWEVEHVKEDISHPDLLLAPPRPPASVGPVISPLMPDKENAGLTHSHSWPPCSLIGARPAGQPAPGTCPGTGCGLWGAAELLASVAAHKCVDSKSIAWSLFKLVLGVHFQPPPRWNCSRFMSPELLLCLAEILGKKIFLVLPFFSSPTSPQTLRSLSAGDSGKMLRLCHG